MSNDPRPTAAPSSDACQTEVLPVVAPVPARRSVLRAAGAPRPGETAAPASTASPTPFPDRRDQAPTVELPVVAAGRSRPARVSTLAEPTGSRVVRHLRAALAGLLIAAALLTGLQLYAAAGISSARQAALAQRDREGSTSPVTPAPSVTPAPHAAPTVTPVTPVTPASPVNTLQGNSSETQNASAPDWATRDTGAAYDRTNPAASPLDLPRCTTSPDTPLPCLAWKSADSTHVTVLEEDASLTALVRQ